MKDIEQKSEKKELLTDKSINLDTQPNQLIIITSGNDFLSISPRIA